MLLNIYFYTLKFRKLFDTKLIVRENGGTML